MKKIFYLIIVGLFISFSALADDITKKPTGDIKECWTGFNKATFSLNQALDGILFEPFAKGYRYLPSPIRTGTSNMVSNISNLMTIPNNLLQGDFKSAANNTMRLVVNSTLGILQTRDIWKQSGRDEIYEIGRASCRERV